MFGQECEEHFGSVFADLFDDLFDAVHVGVFYPCVPVEDWLFGYVDGQWDWSDEAEVWGWWVWLFVAAVSVVVEEYESAVAEEVTSYGWVDVGEHGFACIRSVYWLWAGEGIGRMGNGVGFAVVVWDGWGNSLFG